VSRNLLILGWHNARPTPFFPSAGAAAARGLWQQLRLLRRACRVVPLDAAVDALAAGRPLPPRAVALTFDDGYRDNLETVAPMLRRLGLPATFYLVPGLIERTSRPWWETVAWAVSRARADALEWRGRALPAGGADGAAATVGIVAEDLKRMSRIRRDASLDDLVGELRPRGSEDGVRELFLDWVGARELAESADVGSHTCTHPILSEEAPADQGRELARSRARLEEGLGRPVRTIAYPNGTAADYDAATLAAAGDAGYAAAVTTTSGWNDASTPRLELRRFILDPVRGADGLRPVLRAPGAVRFALAR